MKWTYLIISLCSAYWAHGQSSEALIQRFLEQQQAELGLSPTDIIDWGISSHHISKQSGAHHVYIYQTHQNIPLCEGVANFTIKEGRVRSMGNNLVRQVAQNVNATVPTFTPIQAVEQAAQALGLHQPTDLRVLRAQSSLKFTLSKGGISLEEIPVRLSYTQVNETELRLAWDLSIYQLDAQHWWSIRIDALTGKVLNQYDWVVHCQFDGQPQGQCLHTSAPQMLGGYAAPEQLQAPDQYNVFALPTESPSHGPRSTVVDPADSLASPYAWHDINAQLGAEFTITRGNNVHAYEDTANLNAPGYSPNGGSSLNFNFPYVNGSPPSNYLDAVITNLFYMNNTIHDVWYHYGFDEASGNFQQNNYGRSGAVGRSGDPVRAEAQDGSGTSNANFATPPDGSRPRMQMYIWPMSSNTGRFFDITAPNNIAGSYIAARANFGPPLPAIPIVGNVVILEDALAPTADGCDSVVNPAILQGNIVMIHQGGCTFSDKVEAAQNAGAIGVIVVGTFNFVFVMGGINSNITIPSVMVQSSTGAAIRAALQVGTVTAELSNNGISDKDSDLDNGIIIHEYGHGISTRLTGGAAASNCLRNEEQMGEGWSDWFGLMMTIEPGDQGSDIRGIGTYVQGESTTGPGIRPAPYSTDFTINNYTYAASNRPNISQPHGVGFIFATVLWDLTWALIDAYGGTPDPDLYHGTGGNNIAMQLVIEGLKIQGCSPGMLDGRDAILTADSILYGGAHWCLIWETFARRGFGYSASQGNPDSRFDQIEAFDLHPTCLLASAPPVADFVPSTFNSCVATMNFYDSSQSMPHFWAWDFGDGGTSTDRNPTHTYRIDGTYNVRLIVTNNLGSDTAFQSINVTLPPIPTTADVEVCAGDASTLVATGTGDIQWRNINQTIIQQGDTLRVTNVGSISTYYVENLTGASLQNLGVTDTSVGASNLDLTANYFSGINFYADQALDLVTAEVYAGSNGLRTFSLVRGQNNDGSRPGPNTIVGSTTLFLQSGWQKIQLQLPVPDTGWYCLGGTNLNLYQTTTNVNYPYRISNLLQLNSSSSSAAPTGTYYYFYNLEVREKPCVSPTVPVQSIPVTSAFTYTNTGHTFTFTDASIDAVSWFWEFGDGTTSTQQNPTHTYPDNAMRTVRLTINGGSCVSEQVVNGIIGVQEPETVLPRFYVHPNPAKDWTRLELSEAMDQDLMVQVYDLQGRILRTINWNRGDTVLMLPLKGLVSGVYIIHLQGLNFTEIRKIRIQP